MSRHDEDRLNDIAAAIDAIPDHLTRGNLGDGLIYDAVRVRPVDLDPLADAVRSLIDRTNRDDDAS